MKEKLYKLLFPREYEERDYLSEMLNETIARYELERKNFVIQIPKIEYANVDRDGYPLHYLDGKTKEERLVFQGELNSIYMKKEFQSVLDYWINMFGNHAVRNETGDSQPGRYSINGVMMIRQSLESAHIEITDETKPKEEFDRHAILSETDL